MTKLWMFYLTQLIETKEFQLKLFKAHPSSNTLLSKLDKQIKWTKSMNLIKHQFFNLNIKAYKKLKRVVPVPNQVKIPANKAHFSKFSHKFHKCNKIQYGGHQKETDYYKISLDNFIRSLPKYGDCN